MSYLCALHTVREELTFGFSPAFEREARRRDAEDSLAAVMCTACCGSPCYTAHISSSADALAAFCRCNRLLPPPPPHTSSGMACRLAALGRVKWTEWVELPFEKC